MGRTAKKETEIVREYFSYSKQSDESSCKIDECDAKIAGNHAGNLERHINRRHPEIAVKISSKKEQQQQTTISTQKRVLGSSSAICSKVPRNDNQPPITAFVTGVVKVQLSYKDLMEGCVEMVTKNGRPLSVVEDSGFRKIIDPIIHALKKTPNEKTTPYSISRNKVREEVQIKAKALRETIKEEVKGRLVCLKLDCATRLNRSILGIGVQFFYNDQLVLRMLSMEELFERHYAITLKEHVTQVLSSYGIKVWQVFSSTSDNGANMLAATDIMDLEVRALEIGDMDDHQDHVCDCDTHCESAESSDLECPGDPDYCEDGSGVIKVRCAAHTLQLAVVAVLRHQQFKKALAKARNIVVFLKTQTQMMVIRRLQLPKPIQDCVTRWNSTYEMCSRLAVGLRDHIESLAEDGFVECQIYPEFWQTLDNLLVLLKPAKEALVRLQKENLSLGEFYGIWLRLKACVQSNSKHPPSKKVLLDMLNLREAKLVDNEAVVMAIFLHPRYRVLLSPLQQDSAKRHLRALLKRKELVEEPAACEAESDSDDLSAEYIDDPSTANSEERDLDIDPLEELLRTAEASSAHQFEETEPSTVRDALEKEITDYMKQPRGKLQLESDSQLLKFWISMKASYPLLSELALVVMCVPPTQVTIERAFSSLKFILSDQRASLTPDILDDILMLRLN
jgi:hypothetical protein